MKLGPLSELVAETIAYLHPLYASSTLRLLVLRSLVGENSVEVKKPNNLALWAHVALVRIKAFRHKAADGALGTFNYPPRAQKFLVQGPDVLRADDPTAALPGARLEAKLLLVLF